MRAFLDRSKAIFYEIIMTFLQGAIKWSHEGFRYFQIMLIFIIVNEIGLYTRYESHLEAFILVRY